MTLSSICLQSVIKRALTLKLCNVFTRSVNVSYPDVPHNHVIGYKDSRSWFHTFERNYSKRRIIRAPKKLTFDYSGDEITAPPLQMTDTVYQFRKPLSEFDGAPEIVQQLNSLEYADGHARNHHRLEEMKDRIQFLFGPDAMLEQGIARLTVQIRILMPHCYKFKKDKIVKSRLVEKIQMRRKMIKYLRREDYEKFLWLMEELKIRYVPLPEYQTRVSKKYRIKSGVRDEALQIRLAKMAALKAKLQEERIDFEKHKEKVLAQIEKDIAELNLDRNVFEQEQIRRRMTKLEAKQISFERAKEEMS